MHVCGCLCRVRGLANEAVLLFLLAAATSTILYQYTNLRLGSLERTARSIVNMTFALGGSDHAGVNY